MTAAHCLYTWSNQLRPVDSLVVRTGVHNRTHGSEVHQQILKVSGWTNNASKCVSNVDLYSHA